MYPCLVTSAKQTQDPCSWPPRISTNSWKCNCRLATAQQLFWHNHSFWGVSNQVWKLQKFQGVLGGGEEGGLTSTPWNVGGSKAKVPSAGVIDIFWNYTICPFSTTCDPDYHISLKSWWSWSIIYMYLQYMYRFILNGFSFLTGNFLFLVLKNSCWGNTYAAFFRKVCLYTVQSITVCPALASLSISISLPSLPCSPNYDITVWPLIYKKLCNANNHVKVTFFWKYTEKGFRENQTFQGCSLFFHGLTCKATQ